MPSSRGFTSRRAFLASALITLALGLAAFVATVKTTSGFLAWSDGYAYFIYARSVVVDGDTDITNEYRELDARYPVGKGDNVLDAVRTNAQRHPGTGRIFVPWPPGTGVVLAPFYAVGWAVEQAVAKASGRAPDSYGLVPQYAFALGSLSFALIGFWASVLCCRRIAGEPEATLGSAAAIWGGPLLFYVLFSPTMAHSVTFGLFALFVVAWWRQWDDRATATGMVVCGLLLGILGTIRFQNLLFGLPAAALVIRELRRNAGAGVRAAFFGAMGALPPLALMVVHIRKYVFTPPGGVHWLENGSLLIGQYPVDLRSPFFLDVLFSCQHGAFYWSPLLGLGCLGLLLAAFRNGWAALLLGSIVIQVWLIGGLGHSMPSGYEIAAYSIKDFPGYKEQLANHGALTWANLWWGGPMFGMRYLSESAHLFAAGLAYLFANLRRIVGPRPWYALVAFLVAWNLALIAAYGLNTVSRTACVTYPQMWSGVEQVAGRIAARLHR